MYSQSCPTLRLCIVWISISLSFFMPSPSLDAGGNILSGYPLVHVFISACIVKACEHMFKTAWGNFTKLTLLVYLETNLNWLDLRSKRSKVIVMTRPNMVKKAIGVCNIELCLVTYWLLTSWKLLTQLQLCVQRYNVSGELDFVRSRLFTVAILLLHYHRS